MPDSLHSRLLTSRRTCSDKLEMRAGSFVCSSKALSFLDTLANISHKHCSAGRSCCTHRIHQALMNKALPCVTLLRPGKEHFTKRLAPGPQQSLLALCFSLIIWGAVGRVSSAFDSPYQALVFFPPQKSYSPAFISHLGHFHQLKADSFPSSPASTAYSDGSSPRPLFPL